MDAQNGNIPFVFFIQFIEVWQLCHTWRAVDRPQIDECNLPPCISQMECRTVKAFNREVLQLLPDFKANRRVTGIILLRGGFCLPDCSVCFLRFCLRG